MRHFLNRLKRSRWTKMFPVITAMMFGVASCDICGGSVQYGHNVCEDLKIISAYNLPTGPVQLKYQGGEQLGIVRVLITSKKGTVADFVGPAGKSELDVPVNQAVVQQTMNDDQTFHIAIAAALKSAPIGTCDTDFWVKLAKKTKKAPPSTATPSGSNLPQPPPDNGPKPTLSIIFVPLPPTLTPIPIPR